LNLSRVCCCDTDPCETDFDFWDCCSGRRNYTDAGGNVIEAKTLGVSMKRFFIPSGELVDSYGSGLIHITELPNSGYCIGGFLNYGESAPNDYDYFGAKAGAWPTPSPSDSDYARELKLRQFGAQLGNNWNAGSWKVYNSTNVDEVLRGLHTPTSTGTFDRLSLSIRGPGACTSPNCNLLATSNLSISSSTVSYSVNCSAKWYRCTEVDGGLTSDCTPVSSAHPECCKQCPQDLEARIVTLTKPQNYIFGNACGVPADTQAAVEATNPGFYSSHWWQGFFNSTGGTNYFGQCVNGWHWDGCGPGATNAQHGTAIHEDSTCTCCAYELGNREVSITVIT